MQGQSKQTGCAKSGPSMQARACTIHDGLLLFFVGVMTIIFVDSYNGVTNSRWVSQGAGSSRLSGLPLANHFFLETENRVF